jgi:hypothetical protein
MLQQKMLLAFKPWKMPGLGVSSNLYQNNDNPVIQTQAVLFKGTSAFEELRRIASLDVSHIARFAYTGGLSIFFARR